MPNWCNNFAVISHEDPSKIDLIENAGKADSETGILQTLLPCPVELTDTMAGSYGDDAKQAELEARTRRNVEKYGYGNWYDWNCANWGTKWDLCEPQVTRVDANTVEIGFDTAWSPPIAAYEQLQQQGFNITAYYYEGGMCYAGKWEDGVDECYQDWGDAQGARDTLPEDLDEMFAISESQEQYEEEERMEEELYRFTKEGAEKKGLELKTE